MTISGNIKIFCNGDDSIKFITLYDNNNLLNIELLSNLVSYEHIHNNKIDAHSNLFTPINQKNTEQDTLIANLSSQKADKTEIPTKTSDLTNDSNFVITSQIPIVNNATLTIQKNSTTVDTFTANASTDKTINITVPTNTNELTNGAGFLTSSDLSSYATQSWINNVALSGYATESWVNNKGYITSSALSGYATEGWVSLNFATESWVTNQKYVQTVNNTQADSNGNVSLSIPTVYDNTITIQKNGTTVDSFTTNASLNKTINITVPTNTNELTNGAGFITGINSSDVTTALGYTPYNATNPSGYITSSDLTDYQLIAQPVTTLSTSGTVTLSDNTVNKITPTGNVTFSLPTVTDLTKFHQILVQLNLSTVYTITLGTTYYFNKTAPDLSATGVYNLIFEYDNSNGYWVVGCVPKGAST